jgi:UDP-N-acetylglucosamine--N-acetylmuramyl-(pentapeptide) pyrophosphoryl-undecaprenol N-acetylglucosamine transferase
MRVLIAGGGTGGHLYPGIAIAEEVTARPGGEVLFVGSRRGLEARVVPALGYPLELMTVSGLKRVGPLEFATGLARLPPAFAQSLKLLWRFRPDVVLGVGGYASGPLVLLAALSARPTAIQEQNSAAGVTNRILGRIVNTVFVAFPAAAAAFPERTVADLGNPVRRRFLEAAAAALPAPTPDKVGRLLVVGGSQGARAVNDLVLGAAEVWTRQGRMPALVHQTGTPDVERCQAVYARLGVADRVTVQPFIEDMAAAYTAADLVVGRAGALTLAELAVIGRPALLIPLPTAADDHQSKNAEAFAAAGAAVVHTQALSTADTIAAEVTALLGDAKRRRRMAAAMKSLARPNAARDIVDRLAKLGR